MGIRTTPATGANGRITIGQQAVFNRIVPPTHLIEFTSESIIASETPIESQGIRGDRAKHDVMRGYLDVGGDISAELAVSGFGILIYNMMGNDYLLLPRVDGGYHARLELGTAGIDAIPAGGPAGYFLEFAPEAILPFPAAGGQVKFAYRANNTINLQEVSPTVGYVYTEACPKILSYVAASTPTAGPPPTALILGIAKVLNEDGIAINPEIASAGVIYLGNREVRVRYTLTSGIPGGTGTNLTITVDPADLPTLTLASDYAVGVLLTFAPGLLDDGSTGTISDVNPALPKGSWTLLYLDNVAFPAAAYDTIYTHLYEASRTLPPGMTVEVDRDAAIFTTSGEKVNTGAFSFEPGNPVTGVFSLLGREEFSMAKLVNDVQIGATSITVVDASHFPQAGIISVGGSGFVETNITYTSVTKQADGTYIIAGIPASGAASIEYVHRKGGNVDSRTSNAVANLIEGTNQPLVPFEATIYIDGDIEEVLSASVNVNNNLNADKRGLGERYRLELVPERRMVDGNLNVEFDDGHNYRKFVDGEFMFLEIRCVSEQEDDCGNATDETGVLGQMYFIMPSVRYGGTTPTIEGESYITHDLPIMAKFDDCYNTPDIVIIAVNRNSEDAIDQTGGAGAI